MSIYKNTGPRSFSLLATGGTAASVGDTITFEADGSNLTGYINGVSTVTASDSMNATGKPGMYGGGNRASVYDDFKYETFSSAPPPSTTPFVSINAPVIINAKVQIQ